MMTWMRLTTDLHRDVRALTRTFTATIAISVNKNTMMPIVISISSSVKPAERRSLCMDVGPQQFTNRASSPTGQVMIVRKRRLLHIADFARSGCHTPWRLTIIVRQTLIDIVLLGVDPLGAVIAIRPD